MTTAHFKTERVEYIIDSTGYSRNGHFTAAKNIKVEQLSIGKSASFSYTIGNIPYKISTDRVLEIRVIPHRFLKDVGVFKMRIQLNSNKQIIRYCIGSRQEVSEKAIVSWPEALMSIEPHVGSYTKVIAN